jgi:hypothetical protein
MWNVRSDVFTVVTMKGSVFCDIKTRFVPQMKHITSPLQSPSYYDYVRTDVSEERITSFRGKIISKIRKIIPVASYC